MPIDPLYNDGRQALGVANDRLREAAGRIARLSVNLDARDDDGTLSSGLPSGDGGALVDDLVALRLYRHEIGAAARVVETADEILGTLLDIRV